MRYLATLATFVAISATVTRGSDWPQWQGPHRNGISDDTGLLQEWPEHGPSLVWKNEALGGGYSAPSVVGGRMFGMSFRDGEEVVWALAESDGTEQWATTLGPAKTDGRSPGKEGPGCTPTVDGDRLYVIGAGGTLACLQVEDGKIIWQHALTEQFGGVLPTWRYNESPLVDGEKVICTPGGPEATLVALNKMTGDPIWKSVLTTEAREDAGAGDRNRGQDARGRGGFGRGRGGFGRGRGGFGGGRGPASTAGYASAIAFDFAGQRQYVQLTASALVGVAASDGKMLWRYDRPANRMGINCSTPIHQDGKVFAASAYGAGGGLVKLSEDADGRVTAEEVYEARRMENHHGGMIVFDGCLYGANGGNGGGFLTCIDFGTGDVLWQDRDAQKGALAFADGRLYLRTEDGEVLLIEPNDERLLVRGRFDQPDRSASPAWTHPVIANGKLYVRDQNLLLCYDVAAR